MKTIILVVIYNKNINESQTLRDLCELASCEADILLFNNGPQVIEFNCSVSNDLKMKFKNVTLLQDTSNLPLSVIYNKFIDCNLLFDRYIFLDDDSNVTNEFINSSDYFNSIRECDFQLPRIFSITDAKYHYPRLDGSIPEEGKYINISNGVGLLSIGSGLILYKNLINKFKNKNINIFDERYALYGVDYSFFRRLILLNDDTLSCCVIGDLKHNLSSMQIDIEPWRKRERLVDHVLTARYYSGSSVKSVYRITSLLVDRLISREIKLFFFIIYVLIKGKHPRCFTKGN